MCLHVQLSIITLLTIEFTNLHLLLLIDWHITLKDKNILRFVRLYSCHAAKGTDSMAKFMGFLYIYIYIFCAVHFCLQGPHLKYDICFNLPTSYSN